MRDSDGLDNNPHISRSALEAIHDQVFGWALSRCNYERTTAEDLVQETYVHLLSGKAKFAGRSSLKTFVFSVVQNLARSRYRRTASRLRLVEQFAMQSEESVDVPDHGEGLTVTARSNLWRAVQQLPRRQRDVIELVFCRDMTIDEACSVMGVSSGTGRVHYARAKKALKSRIGGQSNER